MRWSNCIEASEASGRSTLPLVIVRAGISVSIDIGPTSTWYDVAVETTRRSFSSHQVWVILMVGVNVPLARSWDNSNIFPLVPVALVNYMGSLSMPHITCTWRGCTAAINRGSSPRLRIIVLRF